MGLPPKPRLASCLNPKGVRTPKRAADEAAPMLRQLRTKFIALNMALAALVLAASFATICYADYRADVAEQQRLAAQERLDSQPLPNSSLKKTSGGRSHQEKLKFSFKEQREYEEIDGVIAGLEEKIAQTEALIAQNASDYAALQELTAEKEELEAQLTAKMERWVYLNDLAERIEAQGK